MKLLSRMRQIWRTWRKQAETVEIPQEIALALGRAMAFLLYKREVPVPDVPPKKRTRKPQGEDEWHITDLLETLDGEHERFKLRASRYSLVPRRHLRAIDKMGPLVIPDSQRFYPEPKEYCPVAGEFPFLREMPPPPMAYLGWHRNELVKELESNDIIAPVSMFAIRWDNDSISGLQKTPGQRYLAGLTSVLDGELLGVCAFATVDFDGGTIYVPRQLCSIKHTVGDTVYCERKLTVPNADLWADPLRHNNYEGRAREIIRCEMAALLHLWARRDMYYQISTRKNKSRVTFIVHPGKQVPFFRDRERTAIASDGKLKRIVHYVQEHERVLKDGSITTVRAHLRGVRRFRWNGYDVAISVPRFHLQAHKFDVEPISPEQAQEQGRKTISTGKSFGRLAKAEDTMTYRHGEQGPG